MKKKLATTIMLLFALCFILSISSYAGSNDKIYITNLKQNQWTKKKESGIYYINDKYYNVRYFNKITIPSDGYITIKFYGKIPEYDSVYIYNSPTVESDYSYYDAKQDVRIALPKGTFYIVSSPNYRMKYTFTPVKDPANYCFRKATNVVPGKTYTLTSYWDSYYNHYYKLNLKKKGFIDVNVIYGMDNSYIDIYNSRGGLLDTKKTSKHVYTYEIQKPGIYYISIQAYNNSSNSAVVLFKLKK